MTKEQLLALEAWIVSIIRDEADVDNQSYLCRVRCLDDVREKFGLEPLNV